MPPLGPFLTVTRPLDSSVRIASRITTRLTPNCDAKSRSEGMRWNSASLSLKMVARMRSATSR